VSIGLVIFVSTFFVYAERHADQIPGGYLPGGIGIFVFLIAMSTINYLAFSGSRGATRLSKALAIAVLEVVVFIFLLLFLLVNTFGS